MDRPKWTTLSHPERQTPGGAAGTKIIRPSTLTSLPWGEQREQLKEKKEKGAAKDRAKASSVPVNTLQGYLAHKKTHPPRTLQ